MQLRKCKIAKITLPPNKTKKFRLE